MLLTAGKKYGTLKGPSGTVILATTFTCRGSARRSEWDYCLRVNAENPNIEALYVFLETISNINPESLFPGLKNRKVSVVRWRGFPSFRYVSNYVAAKHPGDPVIIANGDIYFDNDSNIEEVQKIQSGHLWCISRYDCFDGNWRNRMGNNESSKFTSYDSFAFRTPLPAFDSDILIGKLDADLYICQKAGEAGITLLNPSLSIISKHLDSAKRGLSILEVAVLLFKGLFSAPTMRQKLLFLRALPRRKMPYSRRRASHILPTYGRYANKKDFDSLMAKINIKPSAL